MKNSVALSKTLSAMVLFAALIIQHLGIFDISTSWSVWLYLAFFVATLVTRSWVVFHVSITLVLWRLLFYVLPDFLTNMSAVYLLVLFLISSGITYLWKPARVNLEWFRKGKIDKISIGLVIATSVLSGIALILWAIWTDNLGIGEKNIQGIAHFPKLLVLLVIVPLFALLNAFSEEVIYRGIFQEAFLKVLGNPYVAIALQAAAFAALHFAVGFPNGVIGYGMTFVYGATIGYIRHRTGGILAPYLTHIMADLVITYYLCFKFL